jgi:cleavage and polyadenylation specificity factor subunit 1
LEDGTLIIYEAFEDFGYASLRPGVEKTFGLRWVKVDAQALGTSKRSRSANDSDALGPAARHFIPFSGLSGYDGVFVTGENPIWLLKDDVGPPRLVESTLKPVYGFTAYHSHCVISLGEVSIYRGRLVY